MRLCMVRLMSLRPEGEVVSGKAGVKAAGR